MRRRDFLRRVGAGAAGAAALGLGLPRARAAGWGAWPTAALPGLLPVGKRPKHVLEIFMYGGLCPWETFYVVPTFGTSEDPDPKLKNTQWWSFQEGPNNVAQVHEKCSPVTSTPLLVPFRKDSAGNLVHLGPFTEPLRSRKDIVDRLRLHVMSHTLEPHEAAIPYAMSGYRLGQPKLAGVGAAVQHWVQANGLDAGEPSAYMLFSPGDFPTDNLRAASAVGLHPASSRPLAINVSAGGAFIEALGRKKIGAKRPEFDALLDQYTAAYRARMTSPLGGPGPVRSQTLADWEFTLDTLQTTDTLVDILEPQLFEAIGGEACGLSASPSFPRMGLRLAAHLLTRPGSQARYVSVVDGGLVPASGGGGYDTHNAHVADSARNLRNLFGNLTSIINEPGEGDPAKLDLDDTLVVLNTEFGRTPGSQNGDGRNHHPYAYVTVMFGGPVGPDQQGIVGAIGPDGLATAALAPAETRAAILTALGVFPFAPECYAVSDVGGAVSELDAALWLRDEVLGVTS